MKQLIITSILFVLTITVQAQTFEEAGFCFISEKISLKKDNTSLPFLEGMSEKEKKQIAGELYYYLNTTIRFSANISVKDIEDRDKAYMNFLQELKKKQVYNFQKGTCKGLKSYFIFQKNKDEDKKTQFVCFFCTDVKSYTFTFYFEDYDKIQSIITHVIEHFVLI